MSDYGVISKGEYLHKQSNEFLHVDRYLILRRKSKRYVVLEFENLHEEKLTGMSLQIDQLDARGHSLGSVSVEFDSIAFAKGKFILKEKIKVHGACLDFRVKIIKAEYGECVYRLGDNQTFATLEKKQINKPIDRKTVEREVGKEGYVAEARHFKTPVFIGVFALILALVCFAGIFVHLSSFKKNEETFFLSNLQYSFVNGDKSEGSGVYVTGSIGLGGQDIVVPASVDGHPVEWIESGAFKGNNMIQTLTVNGNVHIKSEAFKQCKNLKTVTLNGVAFVDNESFAECQSLESFTANRLVELNDKTFNGCENLVSVLIKDANTENVLTINGHPFNGCGEVGSITIDQFVNYGETSEFFLGITSLDQLYLKNFNYTGYDIDATPERSIIDLFVEKQVESEEESEEESGEESQNPQEEQSGGGTSVLSKVSPREQVSESVKISNVSVGYMNYIPAQFAKELKTSLKTFTVEHMKEETIGNQAFFECALLSQVNLPVKITDIGEQALASTMITSFDISATSTIGKGAFEGCKNLSSVITAETTPLAVIPENAFKGCVALATFTVPFAVEDIEQSAFEDSGLKEITFPENCVITEIKESVFRRCLSLAQIVLPSEITTIGTTAFEGCAILSKVVFGDKLNYIGVGAFMNCVAFTSMDLPSSLERIDSCAFFGCAGFKSFVVPDSVQGIGIGAFSACELESLTIPFVGCAEKAETNNNLGFIFAQVNFDENSAVSDNSVVPETLKTVTLTKGIEISSGAFKDCKHITTFNLPSTIEHIQSQAFMNCASLRGITLPTQLTKIFADAFSNCVNLRKITLTKNLTEIEGTAFNGCFRLFEIVDLCPMNNVDELPIADYALAVYETDDTVSHMPKVEIEGFTLAKTLDTNIWYLIDHTAVGDIVLPDNNQADGYYLPYRYFYEDQAITSVVLSSDITELGNQQFYGCEKLKSIVFNAGGTIDIGENTFSDCVALEVLDMIGRELVGGSTFETATISGCSVLKDVALPKGFSNLTAEYFQGKTTLKKIRLPQSVTAIPSQAFSGCTSLESAELGGATSVGSQAFSGCERLSYVNFASLNQLGEYAFSGCRSLENVNLSKVVSIEQYTFNGCFSLKTVTALSATSIKNNAFSGCNKLTQFYGNKINSVDSQAFSGCSALTSINLSNVTTIGSQAFSGCSALISINLSNVTTIGSQAFSGCSALTSISLSEIQSLGESAFLGCSSLGNLTLPSTLSSVGQSAFYGVGSSVIDMSNCSSIEVIPSNAFSQSKVITVSLPSSVKEIGSSAFSGCTSLTSINLSNVTTIGNQAFSGCTKLSNITFGSGVNISSYAFNGCSALTSITAKSAGTISANAFNDCSNLVTADLSSTTEVYKAFTGCSKLKTLRLDGVSYVRDQAFEQMTSIERLSLSGAGSVGNSAFSGCTGITTLTITGVSNIGSYAFSGCTGLKELTLSTGDIGSYAFSGCTGIKELTLSTGNIGSYAFSYCTGLEYVILPSGLTSDEVDSCAFTGCYNLREICNLKGYSITLGSTTSFGNVGYYAVICYTSDPTRLQSGKTSEGFVCKYNDSNCWIVGYEGNSSTVTVGNSITVNGKKFSKYKIAKYAFHDDYSVKTLYVNSGVTSVDEYAFPSVNKLILSMGVDVKQNSFGSNDKTVYYRGSSSFPSIDNSSIDNSSVYYYVECVHGSNQWTERKGQIVDTPSRATETVNATCTENGYIRTYCPHCDHHEYQRTISYATGHRYYRNDYVCDDCGYVKETEVTYSNYDSYDMREIIVLSISNADIDSESKITTNVSKSGERATITIRATRAVKLSFDVNVANKGSENDLKIEEGSAVATTISDSGTKNYDLSAGESLVITYTIGEKNTDSNPYVYLSNIKIENP